MSEFVTELRVIEPDRNLFSSGDEYTIPLYQRAFAWEDRQLIQFVEDIADIPENGRYYIGSLIVSRQGDKYEVVDGQQRLTALYMLLSCLDVDLPGTLTFACRDKSNYTLEHLADILRQDRTKLVTEKIEPGIKQGLDVLQEEIRRTGCSREELLQKLGQVILYRIEVPENTDLNRYFEIMNTRGEQLEQHDILKATLMSYLDDDLDKSIFARIWDACSDMTGYVQMHFVSENNAVRDHLFGSGWDRLPPAEWEQYRSGMQLDTMSGESRRIDDMIAVDFHVDSTDGYVDEDARVRFESIIEYPFFLLHTLKVLIEIKGIRHEDGTSDIIAELLDDKKLIDSFSRVIRSGVTDAGALRDGLAQFARDFIVCLLRTRYLFDAYIIKREYVNDDSDGEWSLKSLHTTGQRSKKKPYYKNSQFTRRWEWASTYEKRPKQIIMIQSALRVSYTSPKVMHWITQLLQWLSSEDCSHVTTHWEDMAEYHTVAEAIAQNAVRTSFFDKCENGVFAMGVDTPHIVFNYLDYLLWLSHGKDFGDFVFEFRNSVEHWYPRNPSEGTFEPWKGGVDQFGNLCIIQRSINSKFSNLSPEAKKSTFEKMIAKGSLKLRIMSQLTVGTGEKPASLCWKDFLYKQHEQEMLAILKKACGIQDT